MIIKSYKDLEVWQRSINLIPEIYNIAKLLPNSEIYGLRSQIQRSAISIPSNIAEGSKRGSRADYRNFCLIALGSAAELETQRLVISRVYPDIRVDHVLQEIIDIEKMLSKLTKRLKEPTQSITYNLQPTTYKR